MDRWLLRPVRDREGNRRVDKRVFRVAVRGLYCMRPVYHAVSHAIQP